MVEAGPGQKLSRRRVIDVLLASSVAASLATILYPVLRYLRPLPSAGAAGPLRLSAAELATLQRARFVIVSLGQRRVIVLRDAAGELHALSAVCTHEGCTVRYRPADAVIWCPCHNGRFDLHGRVISGPPPRPLARFTVTSDAAGQVRVMTEAQ